MATLHIVNTPRRLLSPDEAAIYLGMKKSEFSALCRIQAVELQRGKKVYDIRDLDGWVDKRKSSEIEDDAELVSRLK